MTTLYLTACEVPNGASGTAIDRLRAPAADHAAALGNHDVGMMRRTGLRLIEALQAYAGW